MMNLQPIFKAVTRWSLYAAFFLVPLFFLPWTIDVLDTNKQMLLVILTLLSLTSWLGSMVLAKKLSFRTGWINAVPALFLLAVLASSVFSMSGYQTWVGQANQEYTSFLTVAMFVLMFYVILNNAADARMHRGAFLSVLLSAAIVGLLGVANMFGLSLVPFDFAKGGGFNAVGSMVNFSMYLASVMFMGLAAWLVSNKAMGEVIPAGKGVGMLMRALIVVVTACALVSAVILDFWVLWVVFIAGVLMLAAFGFLQTQSFPDPRRFAIPLFILLVSVLLLFVRSPLRVDVPVSVSPSYSASWGISRAVLSEGWDRFALGSGPGTFALDYAKYRPASVNGTIFWNTQFDRSKSHALTSLATLGVVGSVLWLGTMLAVAVLALARLLMDRKGESWEMTYVLFVGWATLFVAHLLYSSNMTLSFLLWGLAGLLAAQVVQGTKETDFARSPRLGLAFSFAFVVVAVGVLATLFVTGGRYAAEVAFAKAVKLDRSGAPVTEVIGELGKAVSHNALSDVYYRNLSSALLMQARATIAEAAGKELTAEQRASVTNSVSVAVNAAKRATDLEPNNVSNWVVRGSVYRDVMSFVSGAEDFAAATFQQALLLEPNNPSHYVNLGRVHLVVADRARALKSAENAELATTAKQSETDQLAAAEKALMSAIQLKPDYAPAHYYLASTYERQGRLDDAVTRLAAIRNSQPNDIGLGFQLSMMYLRVKKYDLARAELERIVQISPNYSNALWYLASLYELDGDLAKAVAAVEKVAGLNPDNQGVKDRLARLRSGETTAAIPAPVEEGAEGATDAEDTDVEADADGEGVVEADTDNE